MQARRRCGWVHLPGIIMRFPLSFGALLGVRHGVPPEARRVGEEQRATILYGTRLVKTNNIA
jgi:hypothetical protein